MRTFNSREFNTSADLADYNRVSLGRDIAQHDQQALTEAMRNIYEYLNIQYGYAPVSEQPKLQRTKTVSNVTMLTLPNWPNFWKPAKNSGGRQKFCSV